MFVFDFVLFVCVVLCVRCFLFDVCLWLRLACVGCVVYVTMFVDVCLRLMLRCLCFVKCSIFVSLDVCLRLVLCLFVFALWFRRVSLMVYICVGVCVVCLCFSLLRFRCFSWMYVCI